MNIYATQLKKSILQKIEHVEDADYLATLDAILTYETISENGKMPRFGDKTKFSWRKFFSFGK